VCRQPATAAAAAEIVADFKKSRRFIAPRASRPPGPLGPPGRATSNAVSGARVPPPKKNNNGVTEAGGPSFPELALSFSVSPAARTAPGGPQSAGYLSETRRSSSPCIRASRVL
jgi:hypothetical protein